jgi:hypothetical protein
MSMLLLSALLPTRMTGLELRRSIRTAASSTSVAPTVASTTKTTTSAVWMAISAWAAMAAARSLASGSQPPVSTTVKRRPPQLAS